MLETGYTECPAFDIFVKNHKNAKIRTPWITNLVFLKLVFVFMVQGIIKITRRISDIFKRFEKVKADYFRYFSAVLIGIVSFFVADESDFEVVTFKQLSHLVEGGSCFLISTHNLLCVILIIIDHGSQIGKLCYSVFSGVVDR